jgi:hypothetical protein
VITLATNNKDPLMYNVFEIIDGEDANKFTLKGDELTVLLSLRTALAVALVLSSSTEGNLTALVLTVLGLSFLNHLF